MSIHNRLVSVLFISIVFQFCTSNRADNKNVNLDRKYNPGHYVAVSPSFDLSEIKHLDTPELQGINKRYFWRTLEPKKDEYDLSFIEEDLDYCARHNKQLIVFLCDRSFWIKGSVPEYLKDYEWENDGGGFSPIRWNQEYVDRFIAMGKAIADRYDGHPNFEGIAIQETSLDIPDDILAEYNFTPEKYRDALQAILEEFGESFFNSNVFWYQNGIQGTNTLIRQIADTLSNRENIVMGGPDILPHRRWLSHTYKIYGAYKDKLNLFCSAQDDSYHHHKNDIRMLEKLPIHEEGYLTMEDIFLYARDEMHVKYLFWNYYYEQIDSNDRSFDDAIKVVQAYPTFNIP